jgi:hypothetical protein
MAEVKWDDALIERAAAAARRVLLHNRRGPCAGLPRAAGWGYPEPYARDLLICGLAAMATRDRLLMSSLRKVLSTLAANRSTRGHIPSLVHDPHDRGASDTTPLFLMVLGMYRRVTGRKGFLDKAAKAALTWMEYQSPEDDVMVAQLPTTDWRDEQWVLGYGLYVNAVLYAALRLFGRHEQAERLADLMQRHTITAHVQPRHVKEGLAVKYEPYYALWSFKLFSSERFDLLGNSLAVLTGLAPATRARAIIDWVEEQCDDLRHRGDLVGELPPNFFPYVQPTDPEWSSRYDKHNQPGRYHNGGIWPFTVGFYVAACVAAGRLELARQRLMALAAAVGPARSEELEFGFNEYLQAQTGKPCGQDWQSWSAGMFLYALACVKAERTPFFDEVRAA